MEAIVTKALCIEVSTLCHKLGIYHENYSHLKLILIWYQDCQLQIRSGMDFNSTRKITQLYK